MTCGRSTLLTPAHQRLIKEKKIHNSKFKIQNSKFKLREIFLTKSAQQKLDAGTYMVRHFVEKVSGEIEKGAFLLDAGAGECKYKEYFSHTRYIALDFAKGAKRWNYNRLNIMGDLKNMPIKDEAFDAILCTQVLEHISKPWEFTKELFRVLKPSGRLFITAPQGGRLHQEPYDFFRYTPYGLETIFAEAGFKVDYIEPKGGYFLYLSNRISFLHRHIFHKDRRKLYKVLFMPLEPISKLVFRIILPLILFHMDPLDKKRRFTIGYMCKFTKPK